MRTDKISSKICLKRSIYLKVERHFPNSDILSHDRQQTLTNCQVLQPSQLMTPMAWLAPPKHSQQHDSLAVSELGIRP